MLSKAQYVLSINRFEKKKNVELALNAYLKAKKERSGLKLVVAGGYDPRVDENVDYLVELISLAKKHDLSYQTVNGKDMDYKTLSLECDVTFLLSFTQVQRNTLLYNSLCLIYTPFAEHFGIVPLESMLCKTPVIALNHAGKTYQIWFIKVQKKQL
jgi:alpha-1,3/alpha-1,6-mannosyltransferase